MIRGLSLVAVFLHTVACAAKPPPELSEEPPFRAERERVCTGLLPTVGSGMCVAGPLELEVEQLSSCEAFVGEVIGATPGPATWSHPPRLLLRVVETVLGPRAGEIRRLAYEAAPDRGFHCGNESQKTRTEEPEIEIPTIGTRFIVSGAWVSKTGWFYANHCNVLPYDDGLWRTFSGLVRKEVASAAGLGGKLCDAVKKRDATRVAELLDAGAPARSTCSYSVSANDYAFRDDDADVIRAFVAHGTNVWPESVDSLRVAVRRGLGPGLLRQAPTVVGTTHDIARNADDAYGGLFMAAIEVGGCDLAKKVWANQRIGKSGLSKGWIAWQAAQSEDGACLKMVLDWGATFSLGEPGLVQSKPTEPLLDNLVIQSYPTEATVGLLVQHGAKVDHLFGNPVHPVAMEAKRCPTRVRLAEILEACCEKEIPLGECWTPRAPPPRSPPPFCATACTTRGMDATWPWRREPSQPQPPPSNPPAPARLYITPSAPRAPRPDPSVTTGGLPH